MYARLEKPIQADVQCVLNAAALLDITEFDVFRLAYRRWHGSIPATDLLEPFFASYMFNEIVPPWVRHFARLVERLNRMERLDRVELGIEELPRTREMVSRGVRFAVSVVTFTVVLIILGEVAARALRLAERCLFPPCY